MDKRLSSFIDEGDYYSAHQLLISHSQRLERNGKHLESKKYLVLGIHSLVKAKAPAPTLFDIISKYMAIAAQVNTPEGDLEAEVIAILKAIVGYQDVPVNLANFWADFATFSCNVADKKAVCTILLENIPDKESVLKVMLQCCSSSLETFAIAANFVNVALFLQTSLNLISMRCIGSASSFKDSFALKNSLEGQPKFDIVIFNETREAAKACNLISLLVELVRRRNAPRELYVQLQLQYSALLQEESVKLSWAKIRDVYWPHLQPQGQVNPLASLLQSMMMNHN